MYLTILRTESFLIFPRNYS